MYLFMNFTGNWWSFQIRTANAASWFIYTKWTESIVAYKIFVNKKQFIVSIFGWYTWKWIKWINKMFYQDCNSWMNLQNEDRFFSKIFYSAFFVLYFFLSSSSLKYRKTIIMLLLCDALSSNRSNKSPESDA